MPNKSNTRRSDGLIRVKVYLGKGPDGKAKYKYCYGHTQKEADEKADVIRASLRKGIDLQSSDSFDVVTSLWLSLKKAEVSADQYHLLKSRSELLKEWFGSRSLRSLKTYDFQAFINNLAEENPTTGKPSAQNTLKSYCQIAAQICEFAVENRLIEYNAAQKVRIPQGAPVKKRHALSKEEREWVMTFEHRAQPAAMLLMLSGLRRGEATALTWDDVNFDKGTIQVNRSWNFKQKSFKPPKNGKARTVYIPNKLVNYLRQLPHISTFVLTTVSGKMMTDTAWKRLFDSYMHDLNIAVNHINKSKFNPHGIPILIRTFTPHDLRHTFATILYESGTDPLVAKDQLGHSDLKTTLAIYTHLSAEHQERSVSKLNDFLDADEDMGAVWGQYGGSK